jgi:pimeloyl-ACP methyl ester carboxylesterase
MSIRPIRHLRGALATVALATVSLAPFALAATADASPTPAKPTVVLVHGAFADSSGFAAVIDRLRHDGYPVRAAPNPLVDLQFDGATVRGFLDSIEGPKIVVGHSYGGAVITQAASGDPDVKALVYLAALAPDRGEVLGELVDTPVAHPIAPLPLVSVNVTQPDGTKRADLYLDPSKFRDRFAADLPQRVADDLAGTQRPSALRRSRARSPSSRPGRPSRAGTSCPSRTRRWRPTSSGSRHTACTRTRARSTARTPSTSATPRQSPTSPSRPRERPAEQRNRLLAP